MENLIYKLSITTSMDNYKLLDEIKSVNVKHEEECWSWVEEVTDDTDINPIDKFITFLRENKVVISKIAGVQEIVVWITYEYKDQCNFEFESTTLKSLGDLNVSLCISCLQG